MIKDDLATRNLHDLNFFDIALDFILLDAFEDLESPPSAVTAVLNNRWLSQNFREAALSTACWSALKAKRRLLKFNNGFIAHFYTFCESLSPVLAWGFMGTDKKLNRLCEFFKVNFSSFFQTRQLLFFSKSSFFFYASKGSSDCLHGQFIRSKSDKFLKFRRLDTRYGISYYYILRNTNETVYIDKLFSFEF
jgi:hypothetical protein